MQSGSNLILIVGSGNVEYVINLGKELVPDQKYLVPFHNLIGGSGVNYTLRLLNAGFQVFPIISIGNDTLGYNIRRHILNFSKNVSFSAKILSYIRSENFFVRNIKTPRTFIIVEKKCRTIFAEEIEKKENFSNHLKNSLSYLNTIRENINCVIIGHIQSDHSDQRGTIPGESTKHVIDSFYNKSLIFANFGYSQISLGAGFWEEYLKKISIFQLNLSELKAFFNKMKVKMCLSEIIEWFRDRCITCVITLDKLGAIGTFKDGKDGVVFSRPYKVKGFVDSTGAGDAFGAGLVSKINHKVDFTFSDFHDSIAEASCWAAYACTKIGGAWNCPDRESLMEFRRNMEKDNYNHLEVLSIKKANRVLKGFD